MTAIDHVKGRLIKNLSKGYRQRVGLAQALIGFPPVLILDEPTVGLDPKQITEVRDLIKGLSKDHTVILSSHILPEVMSICRRVLIINGGRLILEDSIENLEQGGKSFTIRVKGPAAEVAEVLRSTPGVSEVRAIEGPVGRDRRLQPLHGHRAGRQRGARGDFPPAGRQRYADRRAPFDGQRPRGDLPGSHSVVRGATRRRTRRHARRCFSS